MKPIFQPTMIASGLFAGLLASLAASAARAGDTIFVTDFGRVGAYTTSGATVNAALISGLSGQGGIAVSGSSVPEASTWVMSLAGFVALAFVGFRRARSRAVSA